MHGKTVSHPSLHAVASKTSCSPSSTTERKSIQHSKQQNPSECCYGRRRFVDTTDEDPWIKALEL
jgi:hypothetical protein